MVYPRKPLSYVDQITRLKRYVRRLNGDLRRRYNEFFEVTRKRRDCPFEVELRHKQIEFAQETLKLAEACLKEIQRQEAMFLAPFKIGDRLVVEYVDYREQAIIDHVLIVDVCPAKRMGYSYEVLPLTKKGSTHKGRYPHPLFPGGKKTIRASDLPESEEGKSEADFYRQCAKTSRELSFSLGRLDMFEPVKDYMGKTYQYRRRYLTSVEESRERTTR